MDDKKNAGFIIIAVTVILVALSLLGLTFLTLTNIDFQASDNYFNGLQAEVAACSGLDYAMYVVMMDKYGTDSVVYNSNSYRYLGTTTPGYDENYDSYNEAWLGTGTGKIFGSATAAANAVDNNGDGVNDSNWLDAPFSLDKGLRAQYAILIEDVGESRININAVGNVKDASSSFEYGTGATTYDIRLQDVLGVATAKDVVAGTNTSRCGPNGVPGNAGTTASQFLPRALVSDDRPFNVLDAADLCFGTCSSSSTYKSRFRNIINNEGLFQSVRGSLTVYSSDAIIISNGTSSPSLPSCLLLPDGNNYYRLKLDDTTLTGNSSTQLQKIGTITTLLKKAGFATATADQIAVNLIDYQDSDGTITVYSDSAIGNTYYGIERMPYITEICHNGRVDGVGTNTCKHRVELYYPYNDTFDSSNLKIYNVNSGSSAPLSLWLEVTKASFTNSFPGCGVSFSQATSTSFSLGNFTINAGSFTVFGNDKGTGDTSFTLPNYNHSISGLDVFDYGTNSYPLEVTVSLLGSSTLLAKPLVLDVARPSAAIQTIDSESVLYWLYQLISNTYYVTKTVHGNNSAWNAMEGIIGSGEYDADAGTSGNQHTSTKSGSNIVLNELTTDSGSYVVWDPPSQSTVNSCICNLDDTAGSGCTGGNSSYKDKLDLWGPGGSQEFISQSEYDTLNSILTTLIDLLKGMYCSSSLYRRTAVGQRINPIVEITTGTNTTRSDNNWTGGYGTHSLGLATAGGGTALKKSYGLCSTTTGGGFSSRQVYIPNRGFITLGEFGHILTVGSGGTDTTTTLLNYSNDYTLQKLSSLYGSQTPYTSNRDYTGTNSTNAYGVVDNAKIDFFYNGQGTATNLFEYFTVNDPKGDGIDDDGDGAIGTDTGSQAGDLDGPEIQVPGRININTATLGVLNCLPGTATTSLGNWGTITQNIVQYRQTSPFTKIGDIIKVPDMNMFGTGSVDNDNDGYFDDKGEKDLIIRSISNLITTHTNVFAVYVTARIVSGDASQTLAQRKLAAIVDRSVTPVKIRYFRWISEW